MAELLQKIIFGQFRLYFPYSLYIKPPGHPGGNFPGELGENISYGVVLGPCDAQNGIKKLI